MVSFAGMNNQRKADDARPLPYVMTPDKKGAPAARLCISYI
jgi:hypothetical protein